MRILHVTDGYLPRLGGIEVFVAELAARQAEAGDEVTVLTADRAPGGYDDGAPVEVIRTGSAIPGPLRFLPLGRRVVDVRRYDVVHVHLSVASPYSTQVAKAGVLAGIPTMVTVHSMWNGRGGWVRVIGAIAGWRDWPVTWTAVSEIAATGVRELLAPGTPVHVVQNAVDVEWWRALRPTSAPRPVTFVSVMRLVVRKRPIPLLDVLAAARHVVPDEIPMRAVIVGDGPQERRVRQQVQALGLADWVELTGALTRTEIRELYRGADVFVAPSHQESFGIAALEARAAGLAVVAMRTGGVGEFVRSGVEGLLCDDDADMSGALSVLALDADLRTDMIGHNLAHPPVMDWQRCLDGFDAAYASAARATAPAPRR